MTSKAKIETVEADVKFDATGDRWIASARDSAGKPVQMFGRSTTNALRRLGQSLEESFQREVEITPKLHLPEALKAEYNDFAKKLKLFTELKPFIQDKRRELAVKLCYTYRMPITSVAPQLGLSSQRLGILLQQHEMGITPGKVGRPRNRSDDDDDD